MQKSRGRTRPDKSQLRLELREETLGRVWMGRVQPSSYLKIRATKHMSQVLTGHSGFTTVAFGR